MPYVSQKINKSILIVVILLLIVSCTDTTNSTQNDNSKLKNKEVKLFNTELITLHSKIVNQNFEIFISLPYSLI